MKKILITIISLFLCLGFVSASEPELLWKKTWGQSDLNEMYYATDSYDGTNHYAVGTLSNERISITKYIEESFLKSSFSKNEVVDNILEITINPSYYDGVIVKYDSNGNVLWERINKNAYLFFKTRETSDGGALALGLYNEENNQKNQVSNLRPLVLVRYDSNGTILWEKVITLDKGYNSKRLILSSSIDVVSNENIIFSFNEIIIKLDKNGNVLWSKQLNQVNDSNTKINIYYDYVDNDNNIISVGGFAEFSLDKDGNKIEKDYKYIIKYDDNGNIFYNKKIENPSNHISVLMSVVENENNEYVMLSLNYDYVIDNDGNENVSKVYLSFETYDKNGNYKDKKDLELSDLYYNLSDLSELIKLYIDKSNNYILNFYTNSGELLIIRYDKDLNLTWSKVANKKSAFIGFDIDKYNNYIIVGGIETKIRKATKDSSFSGAHPEAYIDQAYIVKYSSNYMINKETEGEGTIEVNLDNAKAGDEITIAAKAGDGYRIDKIIVTDKDGNVIKVSGNKFVMPNSNVTVKVIFTNSPLVNPKTGMMSITFAVIAISVFAFFQYKYFKTKEINL